MAITDAGAPPDECGASPLRSIDRSNMYLFSRTRTAKSDRLVEAREDAIELCAMASAITGETVNVFLVRFGAPFGTMMWTVRVDSQQHLQTAFDKLLTDGSYLDALTKVADHFEGASVDGLARFVSATPVDGPSRFYGVTAASMAAGHFPAATEFGVKVQQYMGDKLGVPTAFLASTYGGFADVMWTVGADTMAGMDAVDEMQVTDTKYHDLLDEASGLFVESTGMTRLVERLN
jgi:hypothetical protein